MLGILFVREGLGEMEVQLRRRGGGLYGNVSVVMKWGCGEISSGPCISTPVEQIVFDDFARSKLSYTSCYA